MRKSKFAPFAKTAKGCGTRQIAGRTDVRPSIPPDQVTRCNEATWLRRILQHRSGVPQFSVSEGRHEFPSQGRTTSSTARSRMHSRSTGSVLVFHARLLAVHHVCAVDSAAPMDYLGVPEARREAVTEENASPYDDNRRGTMKAKTVITFLASLIYMLLPGIAHGQCQIQVFTNYAVSFSAALDSTDTHLITSVVVDGSSSMQMQTPCPDSIITQFNNNKQYITHFPSVQNQIGSVGGWTSGPSFCAECYGSYQSNLDSGPMNPGQTVTLAYGGQVNCSVAGIVFFVSLAGNTRFVQAYYYGSTGSHTYHRCNPRGDACDTVYLVNSPVTDGGWPLFGLFNTVYVNTGIVNLCIVGRHGVRADMCISPDPHP